MASTAERQKIKNIREWVSTAFAYSTVLTPNSQRRRSKWIFLHLVQTLKIFLISLSPHSVFLTGLWAAYILAVSSSFLLTLSTLGKHAGFSISSEEYVVGLRWINAFTHTEWSMLFGVHSFFPVLPASWVVDALRERFWPSQTLALVSIRSADLSSSWSYFFVLQNTWRTPLVGLTEKWLRNPQSHMTERKGCWVTDVRVW